MRNFTANPDYIKQQMLDDINIKCVEELFNMIPDEARVDGLNLPDGISEMAAQTLVKSIAKQNKTDYSYFIGAGAYKKYIPACVSQVSSRFEFNTAYTPYQPEISQGTLQVIYEFQSMICNLTGMDVCNASVYDAASACAEAILMSVRVTNKNKVLISKCLNPEYLEVIKTYLEAGDIDLEIVDEKDLLTDLSSIKTKISSNEYAGLLVQMPNFYGSLEDIDELKDLMQDSKTLLIACVEPSTLSVLKKPSDYGADIVVGDIQTLGNPVSFGGPYAGFVATVDKHKRQLIGRIVGRTLDEDGKQAFTLTLQAREQHIRREKATSNICSNQALVVLNSTVYMSVMGETGLKQAAYLGSKNAHLLAAALEKKGYKVLNKDFFNEFMLDVKDSDYFLSEMKKNNIIAGLKIDKSRVLVCVTEANTEIELENYISVA